MYSSVIYLLMLYSNSVLVRNTSRDYMCCQLPLWLNSLHIRDCNLDVLCVTGGSSRITFSSSCNRECSRRNAALFKGTKSYGAFEILPVICLCLGHIFFWKIWYHVDIGIWKLSCIWYSENKQSVFFIQIAFVQCVFDTLIQFFF